MSTVKQARAAIEKSRTLVLCTAAAWMTLSCGSATPGSVVRPDDPTASEALGKEGVPGKDCTAVSEHARPFLADWDTEHRADLEAAMKAGIAIVHYGCDGIKVLNDCKAEGEYAYASIPPASEERIIEENSDLAATIPLSAAEISAEMSQGLRLKLKYALVGRKGAPLPELERARLKGSCDGATHFVRAALLGAFEFGTATEGSVKGGAKVLGAGAEGSSRSARKMNRSAGALSACKAGSDEAPPKDCENLVQLQLAPVVAKAGNDEGGDEGEEHAGNGQETANPCSTGYVLDKKGVCIRKSAADAYQCKDSDTAECEAQCEKGSAQSCYNAAVGQYRKVMVRDPQTKTARIDPEKRKEAEKAATAFYRKGCDGGHLASCNMLASALTRGEDADRTAARELYSKACTGGYAGACLALASAAERPMLSDDPKAFKPSPTSAFRYTERACKLGNSYGCSQLAKRYIEGSGTLASPEKGIATLKQQCALGRTNMCVELATHLASDSKAVKKDPAEALKLFKAACERNYSSACVEAGKLMRTGAAGPKDAEGAGKFLDHACNNLRSNAACVELGRMAHSGELGKKDDARALELFEKACPATPSYPSDGCYDAAELYKKGVGGKKSPEDLAKLYERRCRIMVGPGQVADKSIENSCRQASALFKQLKDARRQLSMDRELCRRHSDKAACARVDKEEKAMRAKVPPPKPPGGGAPKGPPPPPPKGPPKKG
ncbi:MAG: tetratricopeptide repeat protein [Polyangiaceae bacterium]